VKTSKLVLALLGLTLTFMVVVPTAASGDAREENPLEQKLGWIVGGKWVAEARNGPDGKPLRVELVCRWGLNHRVIEFSTSFVSGGKATPTYDGIYVWHPIKKKLAFWYADREGNLTDGEATTDGNRLLQVFRVSKVDGTSKEFRSTIERQGLDAYDWSVSGQKDGAWVVLVALKYSRQQEDGNQSKPMVNAPETGE
jgi:hypothetical protein